VPHTLILAQEIPVPLPKFQIAPRLNILIPLGPRKEPRYTILFPQTVLTSESPPGSPMGPLWREMPAYRTFLHLPQYIYFYLSLRFYGKGAPSMFPNRVPMDRNTLSPEPLVYSFIHSFMYVGLSPQKGALLHVGKNIRSLLTEPHADRRPTHSGVCPGSQMGSLMTLLSLIQCHAALGTVPSTLAWVDQSLIIQCVS
jgi:hypothetical protein